MESHCHPAMQTWILFWRQYEQRRMATHCSQFRHRSRLYLPLCVLFTFPIFKYLTWLMKRAEHTQCPCSPERRAPAQPARPVVTSTLRNVVLALRPPCASRSSCRRYEKIQGSCSVKQLLLWSGSESTMLLHSSGGVQWNMFLNEFMNITV